MSSLIMGIDPGRTCAIAIMDFDGNILLLKTFKNVRKRSLINMIKKYGKVLVVASDVNPCPPSIKKFASSLGAKVFTPKKSLSKKDKEKLVKDFIEFIENKHEKDALASCMKAYRKYKEVSRRIKEKLKKKNLEEHFDEVLEMIIFEKVENIESAIRLL